MKPANNNADSLAFTAHRSRSAVAGESMSSVSDAVESNYPFAESSTEATSDPEEKILQVSPQKPSKPAAQKPKTRTRSRAKPASTQQSTLPSKAVSSRPDASSNASLREPAKPVSKKEINAIEHLAINGQSFAAPTLDLSANYQSVNQNSDRIAIFIDGSNLFYAASHLNIEVDYRRLLSSLVRGRRLLRAYFYTGVDPQNEKQRGFLLWLNRHGHRVVSKELTHMPDGSRKANMHVEMAVDMMRIAEYCPTLTLLGGDGNLAYALKVLSQRGTFIEVVSLQSMTSDSLIDLADSYTDLADLRDDIKR